MTTATKIFSFIVTLGATFINSVVGPSKQVSDDSAASPVSSPRTQLASYQPKSAWIGTNMNRVDSSPELPRGLVNEIAQGQSTRIHISGPFETRKHEARLLESCQGRLRVIMIEHFPMRPGFGAGASSAPIEFDQRLLGSVLFVARSNPLDAGEFG